MNLYSKNFDTYTFFVTLSLISYVLIYNLFHYDPIQGYDGEAHHAYVQNFLNLYVPGKTNQPSSNFTYEFFSPPLPYMFPSFINETCKFLSSSENYLEYCQDLYGFINILFVSLLFISLLLIYLQIIKKLFRNNTLLNPTVLLLIGLFSANYKAISMIRGEVYIVFLNSFLIYRLLVLFEMSFRYSKKDIAYFGITIGLLALSRQWAFLLFPAYFIIYFFVQDKFKYIYAKFILSAFFIGFVISGWFYISLFIEYGSFTTFNQDPTSFKLGNQPLTFYIPYSEDVGMVFTKPIRPYFENQFLPILYSDLWGDYWGYFSFTSRSLDVGRNQMAIGDYLARVNIVSLVPTFLLFAGLKNSSKSFSNKLKTGFDLINIYVVFSIAICFFGYLWFQISFPEGNGDTNKATYILQIFHLLGLSAVIYLEKLREQNSKIYRIVIASLLIVFIHNFSAMLSHFPMIDFI